MDSFINSPDPQFFQDIRDKIEDSIQHIKARRRLQAAQLRRGVSLS